MARLVESNLWYWIGACNTGGSVIDRVMKSQRVKNLSGQASQLLGIPTAHHYHKPPQHSWHA